MSKGDLDGLTVLGRPLKPVAFGLALTMLIVAQANLRGADRGTEWPFSGVVAALSIAALVCLIVGWVWSRQRIAEVGLLAVVAVYTARAVFIQMSSPFDQAVFFSLTTVVIASGAYLLEVNDRLAREVT